MRDYGRINTAYWTKKKIQSLSILARLALTYLQTSRHSNMIGCYHLPVCYLCADLSVSVSEAEAAIFELQENGLIWWDAENEWVLLSDFLTDNAIENPNQAISALKRFKQIPNESPVKGPCALLVKEAIAHISPEKLRNNQTVLEPFANGFETVAKPLPNGLETVKEQFSNPSETVSEPLPNPLETVSKGYRNQKQEQEQKQNINKNPLYHPHVSPLAPLQEDSKAINPTKCKDKKQKVSGEEDSGFVEFWKLYPARAGGNPRRKAFSAWRARIADGHKPQEILDGVRRYAAYCQHQDKIGTEFVKHAATFLGKDCPFAEPWTLPTKPGTAARDINFVSVPDRAIPPGFTG